ncbi:arsenite efflux MFS transporter ArsK [Rhizobium sp. RU36D]|uniref:arsenite efflux MFS transporter ArsK n=1 Tax=Rhizobium sp. RU36D TaxID=1907415 RepID=UPI0009D81625|nr:arsenite efflux MFS transporter ArsK [Rhizobium sp. RU36D]SMD01193.1 Predicted arabinose efflux permease, MFS family [Rhizobium sp. RU36D]
MSEQKAPARLIWALGATQIIGYGTLYYSFSILAPAIATDLVIPLDWLFGLLSVALLCGGLIAPKAGRWADRFGAGRLMVPGSLAAGIALLAAAFAPKATIFAISLVAMELASAFVLYGTAFTAIVQIGGRSAHRSITHLTLIAGFASTLFWPLTATLHEHLSWRSIYMIFAALNILVCLPIHGWISLLPRTSDKSETDAAKPTPQASAPASMPRNDLFLIMLAAFAVQGLVLSSILVHMVPMVTAMGLGTAGLMISMLFGPAQVASRLTNMLFGGRLSQSMLAVIAALLLPTGLVLLFASSPWLPGVIVFALLFGFGSGLSSIIGGTLPLELFGRTGYGARLGWVTAARQFSSAFAPFAFAFSMERWGINQSLVIAITVGCLSALLFGTIAFMQSRRGRVATSMAA